MPHAHRAGRGWRGKYVTTEEDAREDGAGLCLACGAFRADVAKETKAAHCAECGAEAVFSVSEAAGRGLVEVVQDE